MLFMVHRSSSIVGAVMTLLAMMSSESIYPHLHFGNELQQFERYEFLTRDAMLSQERDFFKTIDECERSIVPEKGHRSYLCRYELRDKRQLIRQPLWSRQVDHKSKGMFKVDCKYSLHLEHIQYSSKSHGTSDSTMKYVPSSIEGSSLVFAITQSHCASKYDHVAKGGSNFEIFVQSSNHLASCNVLDSFNGSYKAYCPLPDLSPLLPSLSNNSSKRSVFLCSNVTVTLHYEHFDAFCDIGHSQFSSLHHVVYRGPACTKQSLRTTTMHQTNGSSNSSSSRYQHIRLASDLQGSLPIWTRRPLELITPSHKAILGSSVVYEWRGVEKKYLKVSRMKRCLQRQTLWFIGESHMRYQFDITMDRYVMMTMMDDDDDGDDDFDDVDDVDDDDDDRHVVVDTEGDDDDDDDDMMMMIDRNVMMKIDD